MQDTRNNCTALVFFPSDYRDCNPSTFIHFFSSILAICNSIHVHVAYAILRSSLLFGFIFLGFIFIISPRRAYRLVCIILGIIVSRTNGRFTPKVWPSCPGVSNIVRTWKSSCFAFSGACPCANRLHDGSFETHVQAFAHVYPQ